MWCLALGGQKRVSVSHKLVLEGGQWLLILQLLSWLVWIQISLRFNSWLVLKESGSHSSLSKNLNGRWLELVTAVCVPGLRSCVPEQRSVSSECQVLNDQCGHKL